MVDETFAVYVLRLLHSGVRRSPPGARLVAIHRSELGRTVPIRRRASSERGTTGNPRIPPSVDRLNSAASASSRVLADPRRAERRPS